MNKIKSQKKGINIDIAIATWKGYPELIKSIKCILANRILPHQLIIVDNNKKESLNYFTKIKEQCSKYNLILKYVYIPCIGLSKARNIAIDYIKSPYFAFIDQDEYIHPEWVANLKTYIKDHEEIDVISGIKYSTKPENYWNRIWDEIYKPGVNNEYPVNFVSSSNSCFKTKFIKHNKIKYDDSFKESSEDRVFSFYLVQAGAKMVFSSKIWSYHDFRDSFGDFIYQWYGYGKSMSKFHRKYFNGSVRKQLQYFLSGLHRFGINTPLMLIPGFILLNLAFSVGYAQAFIQNRAEAT